MKRVNGHAKTNLDMQLSAALGVVRAESIRGESLSVPAIRVLHVLNRQKSFGDTWRLAVMDKGQLSRTLTTLVDNGLVQVREYAAGEGRHFPQKYLRLTARGVEARRQLIRRIRRADKSILETLSASERLALPVILGKLAGLAHG